ncbi:MAG: DUF5658 family protein [bacterium]
MQNPPYPDRRSTDRRTRPTNPLSTASLFGRRKHIRREEDFLHQPYVDLYSLKSVATVVTTLVLSMMDAFFTLRLVNMGGKELNPVMDFFLQFGPFPFLLVKYLLTVSCLVLFLVHKNRKVFWARISVKRLMLSALVIYMILIFYELTLLF